MTKTNSVSNKRLGFGLGMDLTWGSKYGFIPNVKNNYEFSPSCKNFLSNYSRDFNYMFFSFQPKDFDLLINENRIEEYFFYYDQMVELLPNFKNSLALHHTMLNLGSLDSDYPKDKIINFTNKLIERYNLKWVNEDLGIWSIKGKNLPYPLPPLLTEKSLKICIENISYYQKYLNAPLFVEFPGFSEGNSFIIGKLDGFEFYKKIIEETGAQAVLDTGHILSYQWQKGNKGNNLLKGLKEKLPLEHCEEIHLSGCSIINDRFIDFHHGVLLDEQLELLEFLIGNCSHLKAVTYEDPKFDNEGFLVNKAKPNYEKLKNIVQNWSTCGV